jgi:hypothetical protein
MKHMNEIKKHPMTAFIACLIWIVVLCALAIKFHIFALILAIIFAVISGLLAWWTITDPDNSNDFNN